jgi:hypothetical protein
VAQTRVFGLTSVSVSKYQNGAGYVDDEWHQILRGGGVKVFTISPGLLATRLGGDTGFLKKMGVAGPFIRSVIEGERDEDVGKVLTRDGIHGW